MTGEGRGGPPKTSPPGIAQAILRGALPREYRDAWLGDLDEGFRRRLESLGPGAARSWYRGQVVRSLVPALGLRIRHVDFSIGGGRSGFMDKLTQDLKYALRALIKSPGYAVVATVTLALAIGVNTSIFSLVNLILFADMPIENEERAAVIRGVHEAQGIGRALVSVPDFLDLRERSESFQALTGLGDGSWALNDGDRPVRVQGQRVTANLLDAWEVRTALGRGFAPGEDLPGAEPVAMLSHDFWQERYGGDPDVLGTTIRLDGEEHTVIGVLTPEISFGDFAGSDVWVTVELDPTLSRDRRELWTVGVLAPGATHAQAESEVAGIGRELAREHPEVLQGWSLRSVEFRASLTDDSGDVILTILVLTVAFIILIACANVANMLLARAAARSREMAVRAALGAGRVRLVRQLLTESAVVALVSGGLGIGVALGLQEILVRVSAGAAVFEQAPLDGRVLGFTLGISLLTPLLFGLLPALRTSMVDITDTLGEGSARSGGARGGRGLRSTLVGAQVALALTLMVTAGLLVRTVVNLQNRELGFDPRGLVTFRLSLPESRYDGDEARRQLFRAAEESLEGLPGLRGATVVSALPAVDFGVGRNIEIQGRSPSGEGARPHAFVATVAPDFNDVFGIPVVAGRALSDEDGPDSEPVAMLNSEAARIYWSSPRDAVGAHVRLASEGEEAPWRRVVGVAADVRSASDAERPEPTMYMPYAQNSLASMYVVSRAGGDPLSLAPQIRQAVWGLDSTLPVDRLLTVERAQWEREGDRRSLLMLFVSFAFFALIMAGVGIYGVMSYSVSQRSREIGLRLALGAEKGRVRALILRQGAPPLLIGLAVGLGAAVFLSRALSGIVFGISTTDPVTFVGVPAVLVTVGLMANLIPAVRASSVEPMEVLRDA